MELPNDLLVASNREIYEYVEQPMISCPDDEYENRMRTLFPPEGITEGELDDPVISKDELLVNEDVADLLDPGEVDVTAGRIDLEFPEIRHKSSQFYRGAYFLPTRTGEYEIRCSIMCNEIVEAVEQTIKVIVD